MKKKLSTNIKLIQITKDLFWKHGIKRITVEEICKEAEVSKMTFYRHFKNKEAVAIAVIETIFNESLERYHNIMSTNDTFRIKVNKLLKLKQDDIKGISQEFIKDISRSDSSTLRDIIKGYRQQMHQHVILDFKQAQDKGDIRQDLNLDFVIFLLNDLNLGLICPVFCQPQRAIKRIAFWLG